MSMLSQRHDRPEEGQPHQEPARELLGDRDTRVEAVAQAHVAKHEDDHDGETDPNKDFQNATVSIENSGHRSSDVLLARRQGEAPLSSLK